MINLGSFAWGGVLSLLVVFLLWFFVRSLGPAAISHIASSFLFERNFIVVFLSEILGVRIFIEHFLISCGLILLNRLVEDRHV